MKTKTLIILLSLLFITAASMAQSEAGVAAQKPEESKKVNGPVASYEKTTIDMGELIKNNPGTASFKLTNTGNEPLVISTAKASCGCTNLNYPKDPVLPGKSVTISATYNAAALGDYAKSITVTTNADEKPVVLMLKGKVIEKK